MLKIEFVTDTAAFCDDETGAPERIAETNRLLTTVLELVRIGRDSGRIFDLHGNLIGYWGFSD